MPRLPDHLSRLDEAYQAGVRRRRRLGLTVAAFTLAAAMGVVVADGLGAIDAVGVDSSIVRASGDGIVLEVRYPTVTRPALASPFEIVVTRPGGFGGQSVDIAVSTAFLQLWDLNGILPAPATETADGDVVHWSFDPPTGDVLRIVYEARIEPAVQEGESGRVAVLDERGDEAVAVEFETAVRP